MELDNIERLLEKYFEATTTVSEEETLRTYFSQESVATHLERYAPMFQYFSNAKKERFTKQVPLKPRKRLYGWISAAAAVVICAGLFFNRPDDSNLDLASQYTPEEIASAQAALALLGDNFSKGTQKISHLGEFQKNTDKFLIKQ